MSNMCPHTLFNYAAIKGGRRSGGCLATPHVHFRIHTVNQGWLCKPRYLQNDIRQKSRRCLWSSLYPNAVFQDLVASSRSGENRPDLRNAFLMLKIDLKSKEIWRGFFVSRDPSNRISLTTCQRACVGKLLGPTAAKHPRRQVVGS